MTDLFLFHQIAMEADENNDVVYNIIACEIQSFAGMAFLV